MFPSFATLPSGGIISVPQNGGDVRFLGNDGEMHDMTMEGGLLEEIVHIANEVHFAPYTTTIEERLTVEKRDGEIVNDIMSRPRFGCQTPREYGDDGWDYFSTDLNGTHEYEDTNSLGEALKNCFGGNQASLSTDIPQGPFDGISVSDPALLKEASAAGVNFDTSIITTDAPSTTVPASTITLATHQV